MSPLNVGTSNFDNLTPQLLLGGTAGPLAGCKSCLISREHSKNPFSSPSCAYQYHLDPRPPGDHHESLLDLA